MSYCFQVDITQNVPPSRKCLIVEMTAFNNSYTHYTLVLTVLTINKALHPVIRFGNLIHNMYKYILCIWIRIYFIYLILWILWCLKMLWTPPTVSYYLVKFILLKQFLNHNIKE